MADEGDSGSPAGFLPPEPAGPEPDLRAREGAPKPPGPSHGGFAPPAEHEAHAPAAAAYPPAQQQLGWSATPPGHVPGRPQPWTHAPQTVPDNGAAVAGLSLSITGAVLLVLSVGTSSIISIVCAALGIHYSRQGRARVDRGETSKHRGLAQAGFVTGAITLGLSILCTLLWLLVVILYATDEGFRQDLKDGLDDENGQPPSGLETSLRLAVTAFRVLASLIR